LLFVLEREPSWRRRFLLGWLSGAIFWGGTCYWIYDVMHDYAHLAAPAAAAIFAGFFVAKGLHLAVFAVLVRSLLKSSWALPAVSAAWVALEGTHQYLGFTWLHLGNAGVSMSVLARLAPYTGVYGVSFALAMMNAGIALLVLRRPRRELAWLLPLLLLYLLPPLPPPGPGAQMVRLLQPNVHPDELIKTRWTPERQWQHLERMEQLSTPVAEAFDSPRPAFVVWPEYPVPAYYFDDPGFQAYIRNLARKIRSHLIFNAVSFVETGEGRRPLNSALTLSPQGELIAHYSKMFLVPFGEFVPWPFSAFIEKVTLEAGDFVPGHEVVLSPVDGREVGVFICYESVFARGVRRIVNQGAQVLVNISNDSWYGRSAARHQHLMIVRMRAIENARWILRATNDGLTATIDPAGRLRAALPPFERGVLVANFDYATRLTWFTRFGQWFWWLTVLMTLAFLALTHPRRRPSL
jgi:apolipoprotein N-acyltransferase